MTSTELPLVNPLPTDGPDGITLLKPLEESIVTPQRDYKEFGFDEKLIENFTEKNHWNHPFAGQAKLLDALTEHKKFVVVGDSQSGKTSSSVMAAFKYLDFKLDKVQVIYAAQETRATDLFGRWLRLASPDPTMKVFRSVAGSDVRRDSSTLFRTVNHVVVGTAGRLTDLVDKNATDFSCVKLLIIDQVHLMYDRRRREFATSDLIKMMPANCKILLMAQNERGGIMREVQSKCFADAHHIHYESRPSAVLQRNRRRQRNSTGADENATNRSETDLAQLYPDPDKALLWAVVTTATDDAARQDDLNNFFKKLAKQLSDIKLRGNHKIQFNSEPAFINRISGHGPLKQLTETLVKAKNEKVDVLFYVSPILVRQRKSVRRFAMDLGIIYEGVRLDQIKHYLNAGGDENWNRLVRGQANSLLGAYRTLQRQLKAKEGKVEGGETDKNVHFGAILQNEPHIELLPGNHLSIGGPLTIEFSIVRELNEAGEIEVFKSDDGIARIRLNGNIRVLGKVVE